MPSDEPRSSCTHSWKTCPVHGLPDGEPPPFRVVMTCIYGGAELKDGGTWDETTMDPNEPRVMTKELVTHIRYFQASR